MVSLQIAALAVALSGAGDTVLLDFNAAWCAPCRSMDGIVAELERAGYPVRKVDTDRERGLAQQFRVQSVPCFVLLVDGKEAGRITGATRRSELLALYAKGGVQPRSTSEIARAQSPDNRTASGAAAAEATNQPLPASSYDNRAGLAGPAVDHESLIQTSARLKIEDPSGASYGSGTIIDSRQGEALVLTCGHIFRDSQGNGKIVVDLFDPRAPQKLPGRLIAYDLETDIGLVAIRPGIPVAVAPVAPKGQQFARGDQVVTVGCNNGGPATALASQITAVDKFLGPPNLQVAGLPVEGRSGGGLFTTDGQVIGVCNAADPADNEGMYASLASIHKQLDKVGLTAIYQQPAAGPQQGLVQTQAADPSQAIAAAALGAASVAERESLAELQQQADSAEVICIVRSHGKPQARSEVILLDHASTAFLKQLAADRAAQDSRHLTSLEVPTSRPASPVKAKEPILFDARPRSSQRAWR